MPDEIIIEARALYVKSLANIPRSHIWNEGSSNDKILLDIIHNCENSAQVEHILAATDLYAIRIENDLLKALMMNWQKKYLAKQGFEGSIPETPNLCRMLAVCFHLQKFMNLQGISVVELGGGNGQLAAMLKTFGIKKHFDIDIPESLFMAYVCTRVRFPKAKCFWVTEVKEEIPSDVEFVFCPVQNAEVFDKKGFDLFINTASMGELPNDQIEFWMNIVQNNFDIRFFYGLNRFLNTIETKQKSDYSIQRANENKASVLFDAKWDVKIWELEPEFTRCPYQDPKIARYLEILVERTSDPQSDSSYMGEIGMQDWWMYKDVDPLGTHRSNQLVHDFTMKGTLFYLWNTIRITPSKGAVEMMLEYLNWIGRSDLMFEEELYYQELRGRL